MKLRNIFVAALLSGAASFASSQIVMLHGYTDYTNFPVGQSFSQDTAGDWSHTEAAAEFGSYYNGRTQLETYVEAANFHFELGIRLSASLGSWYDNYSTADDGEGSAGDTTYFYKGNMRVDFFKQQLSLYTGKFEEWNNDFILEGYAFEDQAISDLADRSNGQHFTGLEFKPYILPGLRFMAGLPVLPVEGNGVNTDAEYNQWKNLYKKVKFMGSYRFANNIRLVAGWRPETHYEGTSKYSATSYFGEAFGQVGFIDFVPDLLSANVSYDMRYRKVDVINEYAYMYYLGASLEYKVNSDLTLNFEDRVSYADEHYIANNEKLIFNSFGFTATYNIPLTAFTLGFKNMNAIAKDANGSLYTSEGRISSDYSDSYALTVDYMPVAANISKGESGTYIGVYAFPYIQKNYANGYVRAGVEMQYTRYESSDTTKCFGYRVPVALCFYF